MAALERRSLPFLLPSATLTAFVLVIVAVLSFTVIMEPNYYGLITRDMSGVADPVNDCQRAAMARAGGTDAAVRLWTEGGRVPGMAACATTDRSVSFLTVCGLLCVATALHYWFRSTRRSRRRGVRPIGPDRLPELHDELRRLADTAVPGTRVRFLIDLLDPSASGVAFGRARNRHVLFGRGLITLLDRDHDAFEALVLHELAHLRNRDVDLTMITLGFLRAYTVLVFIPVAVGRLACLALGFHPLIYGASAAQMVGLSVLLVVARGQVLRIREYQADARVMQWQGQTEPLRRLLVRRAEAEAGIPVADSADTTRSAVRRRRWASVRRLTLLHPTAESRAAALDAPAPLMIPGFGYSLVLGACLTLLWDPSTSPAAVLSVGKVWHWWRPEPFTVLLMAVLALAALRAAIYHTARPSRPAPPSMLQLRSGLSLGLLAGSVVAPSLIDEQLIVPSSMGVEVGNGLLQAGLAWLLVIWSEYVARAWAETVATARRPWLVALIPCAAVGAVVLIAARPVFQLHLEFIFSEHASDLSQLPGPLLVLVWAEATSSFLYFTHIWWVLGASALLLGVPALGQFFGRRAAGPVSAIPLGSVPGGHALHRKLAAAGVAILTFFVMAYAVNWYYEVMFSTSPLPLGLLVAAATAAAGAATAVLAPRQRVMFPVAISAAYSAVLIYFLGTSSLAVPGWWAAQPGTWALYGVQGTLAASFVISAISHIARALRRPTNDR
jgi:hypothetical protein